MKLTSKLSTLAGAAVLAALLVPGVPTPADAQAVAPIVQCPVGYGYSNGYGCVPVSPGYAAVYGPPVATERPPVYDTFGLSFDFGGGGGHGHGRGHDFHHGGRNFHH